MAAIPMKIKRYVTAANACFRTPSQIVQDVAEQFGVTISKAQVQRYHPQRAQGYSLSRDLRTLFAETRRRFVDEEESSRVPISYRAVRLELLQRMHDKAEETGNLRIALGALKAAHAECVAFEVFDDPSDDEDDDDLPDVRISGGLPRGALEVAYRSIPLLEDPFAPIPDGDIEDPLGISPTTVGEQESQHASPQTPIEVA